MYVLNSFQDAGMQFWAIFVTIPVIHIEILKCISGASNDFEFQDILTEVFFTKLQIWVK